MDRLIYYYWKVITFKILIIFKIWPSFIYKHIHTHIFICRCISCCCKELIHVIFKLRVYCVFKCILYYIFYSNNRLIYLHHCVNFGILLYIKLDITKLETNSLYITHTVYCTQSHPCHWMEKKDCVNFLLGRKNLSAIPAS
jgi:hypothetical protein